VTMESLGDRVEVLALAPSIAQAGNWHQCIMDCETAANLEREWEQQVGICERSPAMRFNGPNH